MLRVEEIRINHLKNPIGVAQNPYFGWILASDRKNVMQKAYRLQIEDAASGEVCYDSGWVESDASVYIKPRLSLRSQKKYCVQVQVRDEAEESPISERAYFVTGILSAKEWQADFISAETKEEKDSSRGTCVRKQINLRGEIESAYVSTTALGLYHFAINGSKVGEDELTPGWTSYHRHLCFQTYEVTEYLRQGQNVLGAMLGAGWYKGKMGFLHLRNNYGEQTAFLMRLTVRYKDGSEECFVTDESWQGCDAPVLFSEIYDGEIYDARLERTGFYEPDTEAGDWRAVSCVAFSKQVLTPQAGSKVKKMEEFPVSQVIVTPQGDTVLDFGQNLTGFVEFETEAEAGEEICLQCFETLDADGNVYTANLRTAKQTIRYICNGKKSVYHPYFTFQGFQYVKLIKWPGGREGVESGKIRAYALYSEMEQTGTFSCSSKLVNQLQHNILWGLKGNFVDIPTDCPQRDERMGWTGDAQIFCRTASYLMNADVFFSKWLTDVAADQTKEGGVPHVVPDIISGKEQNDWLLSQGTHSAAAWADVAVIMPWTMYLVYGDREILAKQYDSMKRWILFMREHSADDIWNYKLQFGDWVALDAEEGSYFGATPNDLTCTAYYAYSTGLFAEIAAVLGNREDAEEFEALHQRVVKKFQNTFFTETGEMTAQTQTAHIIALYFGLVPELYRAKTAKRLSELLSERDGHLVTGFVGTPYFCHALSENGYVKDAYELLLKEDFPSWLYQVRAGATTVWEHWDGKKPDGSMWSPDMNSFNHYAYGAVGDWLYRVVLGIETDRKNPGYRHSIIKPQTGDRFCFAEGTFRSVYGKIAVAWRKKDDTVKLSIRIPVNTRATILLEQGAGNVVCDALTFSKQNGCYQAECGSGEWTVEYTKCQ